ncbi:MAG: ParB/RepB/Spo0J family partition protein [Bacilli bacterium]|jgi:ParB family chromosome partitioning protein|nr:ParB/RepB/Spo0J family partition protein [Bacilli bacterium]
MENRRALGRGLEQLFNSDNLDIESMERQIYETTSKEEIMELDISELRPNPYQPRKVFKDESLAELANSIKEHGVFQPIIVKKSIKGYEIVAGERRYRASKMAGLDKIPAIIRQFTDEQMMEIALLENLQRENLSAIEEAEAYRRMIESLDITQEELSRRIGKSRSHITNILGLLRLPKEVQTEVANGTISMGHARVLSKLESEERIIELAHQIIEEKLPVREIESIASDKSVEKKVKIHRQKESNNDYKYVEDLLREKLDTKVKIKDKKVEIHFSNVADLNRILEILNVKE